MSGATGALARLERLLTIVPWLLEHPGADIAEVSERLGVPREQLLKDLDLLGYCGLPGYGGGDLIEVSIVGDSVTVRMADYFRRPLRLSLREAVTLLLAARAASAVQGLPEAAPLARAAQRLERLLGADAQDVARIVVDLGGPGEEHLPELRRAVARKRVVRIQHRSEVHGRTTERLVEPWAVTAVQGAWYLQGYCRSAQAPRDFRVDRIRAVEVTQEACAAPRQDPPPPRYRPEPDDPVVVLDCAPDAWWLSEWAQAEQVEERGERRRITLRVHHLDWAARLVLRLAGSARVVTPVELAERVAELARAGLAAHRRA